MDKKFDVVIGNPPYQEESVGGNSRDTPIYNHFMDASYEVGSKVVLITPGRFLFNAGQTSKEWNKKMATDPHLRVIHYEPDSSILFPGTSIKGGVVVTLRDESQSGDPIGTFAKFPELNGILHKVAEFHEKSLETVVSSSSAHRYTQLLHDEHPKVSQILSDTAQFKVNTNAFEQLPFIFHTECPQDSYDYVEVLGLIKNKRYYRWVRDEYISGPSSLSAFKVVLAAANGNGSFGEVLSSPLVLGPKIATTQSFITIGCFDDEKEAHACLKYIKTKFARALLGVLKTTQHNPAAKWHYIPLQDFTSDSKINWQTPIPTIDQQLYKKYGLSNEEIDFIESNVKAMD